MLLPAALVLVPQRHWLVGVLSILICSVVLCFSLAPFKPSATFYLLPTRCWELALGSLGALIRNESGWREKMAWLFWPAVLAMLVIPVFPTGVITPWGDAAIVCIATLIVMLRCHPGAGRNVILWPLVRLGDFSYSLYLVHWPIFAFANNAYVSQVPKTVNTLLIAAAVGLGYLLYWYVERPVRRASIEFTIKSFGATLVASIALVVISLGVTSVNSPEADYAYVRRVNRGFSPECDFDSTFRPSAVCSDSNEPKFLVWGDSHAMHLVPGLVASSDLGVAQATKSNCGPFMGMAAIGEGQYQMPWPESCIKFNQSVLDYLAKADSVKYVVLSGQFGYLMQHLRVLDVEGGQSLEVKGSMSLAIRGLRETVSKVRSLGKRVVVVASPPSSGFDVGRCLELNASGKFVFGADEASCRISTAAFHRDQALTREFLALLPSTTDVGVVRFEDFLCSALMCETELEGVFIYRDSNHLSYDGSRKLAASMGLTKLLLLAAK